MSAQDLVQRARELLAAEYERERCPNSAAAVRNNDAVEVDTDLAIRAIVAALRQQPAPAIIDNAGKVASAEPAKAGVVYQLEDDLLVWSDTDEATFNWWRNSGRRNTRKLYTAPQQPDPVVDDTRMARALEWLRNAVAPGFPVTGPKHLPAIEEAIAAYDQNCGARTVRVVDDAMREAAEQRVSDYLHSIADGGEVRLDPYDPNTIAPIVAAALARAQGVQS